MKVRIKIVPNAHPNADGEWVEVEVSGKDWNVLRTTKSWIVTAGVLKRYTPVNHHPVAIG